MTIDEILTKLQVINEHLKQEFPMDTDKMTLARLAKVTEELGELSSEVLSLLQLQRKEKQETHSMEALEKEWADVFGSLTLLGMHLGLDLDKVIGDRLQDIYKRYELEEE